MRTSILTLILVAVLSRAVMAVPVQDQGTGGATSQWLGLDYATWQGQTFKWSGNEPHLLVAVEWNWTDTWNKYSNGTEVVMEIRPTVADVPGNTILRRSALTYNLATKKLGGQGAGVIRHTFEPLDIRSYTADGSLSAVIAIYTTPSGSGNINQFLNGTYTAGGRVLSNNQGTSWTGWGAADLNFRSFTEFPEPATICLLGMGCLALLRKRLSRSAV